MNSEFVITVTLAKKQGKAVLRFLKWKKSAAGEFGQSETKPFKSCQHKFIAYYHKKQ